MIEKKKKLVIILAIILCLSVISVYYYCFVYLIGYGVNEIVEENIDTEGISWKR